MCFLFSIREKGYWRLLMHDCHTVCTRWPFSSVTSNRDLNSAAELAAATSWPLVSLWWEIQPGEHSALSGPDCRPNQVLSFKRLKNRDSKDRLQWCRNEESFQTSEMLLKNLGSCEQEKISERNKGKEEARRREREEMGEEQRREGREGQRHREPEVEIEIKTERDRRRDRRMCMLCTCVFHRRSSQFSLEDPLCLSPHIH